MSISVKISNNPTDLNRELNNKCLSKIFIYEPLILKWVKFRGTRTKGHV
jgi:hypothetical protein